MATFTADASVPIVLTPPGTKAMEEGQIHDDSGAQQSQTSSSEASERRSSTQIVSYSSPTVTSRGDAVPNLKAIYTELDDISDDLSDIHDKITDMRQKLKKLDDLEDVPDDISELRFQVRDLRQRLERHEEDSLESHKLFHAEIDKIKDGRRWIREEMKQQRNAREKMKRRVDELSEVLAPEGSPNVKRLRMDI